MRDVRKNKQCGKLSSYYIEVNHRQLNRLKKKNKK